MKSLATDIAALFNVFGGARPRILLEIVTTSGTKYYSDQSLNVGGQAYEARILTWGRMSMQLNLGVDFISQGRIPLKLSNHDPNISDDIDPNDAVSIYIWDLGAATGSKFKIFEGTVNDDIIVGYDEFSFTCTDVSAKYNKLIGALLPTQADGIAEFGANYNPDPEDVGKTRPIIYGFIKNHRCLVIETGAVTTLNGGINSSSTSPITVNSTADPLQFPASGSIYIGKEKIDYVGITATTIGSTSITRGQGGTQATAHSSGDGVFEFASAKYLVANHIAKEITNEGLIPIGGKLSDIVNISSFVTSTEDDSGLATISITAANVVTLRNLVNLAIDQQPSVSLQPNQPITSTGTHIHDVSGQSEITLYGTYDSGNSLNVTNGSNAFDRNFESTYATVERTWPATLAYITGDFDDLGLDGLTIKEAVACVRHYVPVAVIDTYFMELPGGFGTLLSQTLTQTPTGTIITQKFAVAGLADTTDWSKLNDLRVEQEDNDVGSSSFRVYQLWWEIKYEQAIQTHPADGVTSNRTTDAIIASTASTEVVITGNSITDSLGILICNVKGHPDIGGHWTGSGTDLIEKPIDIFHHFLETYTNGPVAHANIDLAGSFADAETNQPLLDKFGFVITEQIWANTLLTYLAQQFFCRFVWEAGLAKLNRIVLSASSAKSIDTDWDSIKKNRKLAVKEDRWGKDRVWNDITVNFDLDLIGSNGSWFIDDAYIQNTQDDDATSISNNGRQARVFNAFAIGDNSTMADDLRDKYLAFYKDNRKYVSFPSWTTLIDLERGDEIDITTSQLGLSAFDCQIVNVEIELPKRGRTLSPLITALEI